MGEWLGVCVVGADRGLGMMGKGLWEWRGIGMMGVDENGEG